jgi:hypothetical protein
MTSLTPADCSATTLCSRDDPLPYRLPATITSKPALRIASRPIGRSSPALNPVYG